MFCLQRNRISFDAWLKYQPSQHINYGYRFALAGKSVSATIIWRSFIKSSNTLYNPTVLLRSSIHVSYIFKKCNPQVQYNNLSRYKVMSLTRSFMTKATSQNNSRVRKTDPLN